MVVQLSGVRVPQRDQGFRAQRCPPISPGEGGAVLLGKLDLDLELSLSLSLGPPGPHLGYTQW